MSRVNEKVKEEKPIKMSSQAGYLCGQRRTLSKYVESITVGSQILECCLLGQFKCSMSKAERPIASRKALRQGIQSGETFERERWYCAGTVHCSCC